MNRERFVGLLRIFNIVSWKILCVITLIIAAALLICLDRNLNALTANTKIDRILIEKSRRQLSVFQNGRKLKSYRVALGRNPIGPKQEEGDMKTPEGVYQIDSRNANSNFHLALHISYPSQEDSATAARRGVSAGSDIMIHGLPNGTGWIGALQRGQDWTAGCIAVTDREIEELWRVTPDGTVVEIRP